jgi:hypothetical protein
MAQMIADSDQIFNREWTLIHANRLGKTLLAVVATRKRCRSAFWRNPTAYTPCGVCCAAAQFFIAAC